MREILIKMENNLNKKMIKKFLVVAILLLSITTISAFCISNGYITDSDGDYTNATKINVICKRASGDILFQLQDIAGYQSTFGGWYDDCTYCDGGVLVEVFEENLNLYGEVFNETCSKEINKCRTNITLYQVSEHVSSKGSSYNDVPDFGPLAPIKKQMPKSNESPETKIPAIREQFEPKDYTDLYLSIGIILLIIIVIILLKKYGK
jgi:hypothetical protein